jgi:protease-4
VEPLADGRIFTGEEAKNLGLIDRIGNLEDAVEWAGRMAGIEGKISVVYARKKKLPFLKYIIDSTLKDLVNNISSPHMWGGYLYRP